MAAVEAFDLPIYGLQFHPAGPRPPLVLGAAGILGLRTYGLISHLSRARLCLGRAPVERPSWVGHYAPGVPTHFRHGRL